MTEQSGAAADPVVYSRDGAVGYLTLNRPEKRNAMNLNLWEALDRALEQAEEDTEARVVIVRGEGKSFSAGLDLSPENDLITVVSETPSASQKVRFYRLVRKVQAIHTRLERLPAPTVAAIQGHCLGAGLELALCCDIRLACEGTQFALPEATLAIITDVGGLQRLPRVVGHGHAREIAFRGHRFDARRAEAVNLVNAVYPDQESLERAAREIADEIAGNPPLAVQGAKEVFLFQEALFADQSMDFNAARSSMILPSQDLFEAFSAYVQKRKGTFSGQ